MSNPAYLPRVGLSSSFTRTRLIGRRSKATSFGSVRLFPHCHHLPFVLSPFPRRVPHLQPSYLYLYLTATFIFPAGGKLLVSGYGNIKLPHPQDRKDYSYPQGGLLRAYGAVRESEMRNPQGLDTHGRKGLACDQKWVDYGNNGRSREWPRVLWARL